MDRGRHRLAALSAWALATALAATPAGAETLTLFAAASTAAAVDEIAALAAARGASPARISHASSGALAQQIANGAEADIFISANPAWMDFLAGGKAIDAASRVDLVTNRLVLIAPADSRLALAVGPGFALAEKLGDGRLAIPDPAHAAAGIYGRAALETLGVWAAVAAKTAPTADVRAAVALVARGEAAAGLVFATDAALTDKVRIVAIFPPETHPPIVYPAAIVAGRERPEVRRFFAFLSSPAAAAVFVKHGFAAAAAGPVIRGRGPCGP